MNLQSVHQGIEKRTQKKRVGRGIGSGMGKTSTRGHKGQYASAGAKKPAFTFEGGQMPLFRRIPKRGFSNEAFNNKYHVVNVGDLNAFDDGATVDPESLNTIGLAKGPAGRRPRPRQWRTDQEADRQGVPLLEVGRRKNHGQGRHDGSDPRPEEAGEEQNEAAPGEIVVFRCPFSASRFGDAGAPLYASRSA